MVCLAGALSSNWGKHVGFECLSWPDIIFYLPIVINVPLITSMKNLQQLNIASQILTENFLMALTSHANEIKIKVGQIAM